jgi:HAD superfamily hydrolase (TIGR01509 family)
VDEGELVRIGTDEPSELAARRVERGLEVAREERDRLALHPLALRGLRLENRPRRGPVRPMVQEPDRRIEVPESRQVGRHAPRIVPMVTALPAPSALVFDLDGTLVDTVPVRIASWLAAFAAAGIEATRDELAPMIGSDGRRLAREIATAHGLELDADATEELDRRAGELHDELNRDPRPLPGAHDLLALLDKRGVRWAIATSSRREQVRASIAALRLGHEPLIVDGSHVEHAKPAPDLLLLAARELELPPAACWYVGDATWDMRSAVAAGMLAIGVTAGAAVDADALRGAGASVVCHSLQEVGALLEEVLRKRE